MLKFFFLVWYSPNYIALHFKLGVKTTKLVCDLDYINILNDNDNLQIKVFFAFEKYLPNFKQSNLDFFILVAYFAFKNKMHSQYFIKSCCHTNSEKCPILSLTNISIIVGHPTLRQRL